MLINPLDVIQYDFITVHHASSNSDVNKLISYLTQYFQLLLINDKSLSIIKIRADRLTALCGRIRQVNRIINRCAF